MISDDFDAPLPPELLTAFDEDQAGSRRLDLGGDPEHVIPDTMLRSDVVALDITHRHTLRAGALPSQHRDPFDRLLIAQAQIAKLPVMTADPAFAKYEVDIVRC